MTPMRSGPAHTISSQPRWFPAGPLEGLLLRIRCVHRIGGDVTDHDDPDTYHLEYALIGAYLNRCGNGILHTVEIVTDWVEAEAIEEDLAMRQEGAYVMPRDADRAYWLIDMHLVDWADPCVGVK